MKLYFLVDESENLVYGNWPMQEDGKVQYCFDVEPDTIQLVNDGELDFKIINGELSIISSDRKQIREDKKAIQEAERKQKETSKQELKTKLVSGTATLEDISQALLKFL